MKRTLLSAAIVSMIAPLGCFHEPTGTDMETKATTTPAPAATLNLASIRTQDDATVDFLLIDGETVVVKARSKSGGVLGGLPDDVVAKGVVAIYEALSGTTAPRRLVDAVAPLDSALEPHAQTAYRAAARSQSPGQIDQHKSSWGTDPPQIQSFSSDHCRSGWDFSECLTNRTVTDASTYDCTRMYFTVQVVEGSVWQTLKYQKSNGSWVTSTNDVLSAGTTQEVIVVHAINIGTYIWEYVRKTRAIVDNYSTNMKYHMSLYGY